MKNGKQLYAQLLTAYGEFYDASQEQQAHEDDVAEEFAMALSVEQVRLTRNQNKLLADLACAFNLNNNAYTAEQVMDVVDSYQKLAE